VKQKSGKSEPVQVFTIKAPAVASEATPFALCALIQADNTAILPNFPHCTHAQPQKTLKKEEEHHAKAQRRKGKTL
jgi:hypothetical protein